MDTAGDVLDPTGVLAELSRIPATTEDLSGTLDGIVRLARDRIPGADEFSGPVQIPGATLPAGSYVFKLADIPGNRHVVQVFDKDEKKIYTTLLAVPNQRMEPSDKPIILFSERATAVRRLLR